MSGRYRFEGFELNLLDGGELELRRGGEVVPLQELPLRLLVTLVERAPATVSREMLREALWPPGTHLDVDASLNTAVARVREALGDEASEPRFVATVPRRGYRFVAPVERVEDGRSPGSRGGGRRRWLTAAALGVVLLAAGVWWTASSPWDDHSGAAAARAGAGSPSAAREYLLIARHHADRRSREGLEKSIAAFQSAAALDPGSAEAYSGLAASYALLGIYDFWRPREAFGPAEVMARRALELDPESARAHLARGLVAAVVHWDWETATAAVERAVELAPDAPEPWFWRGSLLSALGRHGEALASTERALALAPTSPVINTAYAWHLFQARRGEEAVAQAHRAIELHPDYYDAWDNLKWIEVTLGHESEALEAWVRAEALDARSEDAGREIWRIHTKGGLELLHRKAIEGQVARWESGRYQPPYDVVLEYAALREVDPALDWLERSFAERETDLVSLAVDPRLDALRGHPRFRELLARMGFPDTP
ncbi:MAG: tetratricopeptide repeat protein [Acidobacteriota bacterium]